MKQKLELWLSVIGYEGLYEVSNLGRVRSLEYNGKKRKTPLIMGASDDGHGYLRIQLWKGRKYRNLFIHRLVAEAFILGRKMKKGEFCDHINTIRTDNRLENLRVCSHKQNMNNPLTIAKRKGNKWAAIPLTLRGVKDGSVYRFKSSCDASRFFDYKNETQIGSCISHARKADKRTIKIKGEEFYFEQKGETA